MADFIVVGAGSAGASYFASFFFVSLRFLVFKRLSRSKEIVSAF